MAGDDNAGVPILKLTYKLSAHPRLTPGASPKLHERNSKLTNRAALDDPSFEFHLMRTDFTARNDRWHPPQQESITADGDDGVRKKYLSVETRHR